MKKVFLMFSILCFSFLISRCTPADPVQTDLINYINNELPKVSALETESVAAYSSVSGDNYTTDSAMYMTIKNVVLPKYTEFASKLQAIVPATADLKTVHGEYVKASQDQLEAFKLILDAIDKQDANEIKQANEDLAKARNLIDVWKKDLDDSCKKHDVKLDGDKKK